MFQRCYRNEYPRNGCPSSSIFKNVLFNLQKYGLDAYAPSKTKNPGEKTEMVKNKLKNLVSEFPYLSIRKVEYDVFCLTYTFVTYFSKLHASLTIWFSSMTQAGGQRLPKWSNFTNWFFKLSKSSADYIIIRDETYFYFALT